MYRLIKTVSIIVMTFILFGCDNSVTSKNDVALEEPSHAPSTECTDEEVTTPISPFDSTSVKGCAINE